jgi:Ohr subfamily peroxiredoxin
VTRSKHHKVADSDVEVVAEVGMEPNGSGGFSLSVSLAVTLAGIDQKTAEEIVEAAHAVCPYSNAVRGNIDVVISVATR